MRFISLALLALALVGCDGDSDEGRFVRIGENDGCTLYRYEKMGQYPVYWTRCAGSEASSTTTTQRSGKTSRSVRVQTN